MTNKQIMMAYRAEKGITESTELYTFAVWRSKGYTVKKGEKSRHIVHLWKYTEKKVIKDDQEVKKVACFGKSMYLFERSQVEKIERH